MSTERQTIEIQDLTVEVVRKNIKNLHLAVYPPDGRVRIAVPLWLSDEAVRLTLISRLGWIHKQQARFEQQARQSQRGLVNGESHYVWGRHYRLDVIEAAGSPQIKLRNNSILEMRVRPGTDRLKREAMLQAWYRRLLRDEIPGLIAKWEPIMGVSVAAWGIKRMRTRWGTCNIPARRIWLNLELAKKSPQCLEYVVVHEMAHLLERHHNDNFRTLMDKYLPHWQLLRAELNQAPLAHEEWGY